MKIHYNPELKELARKLRKNSTLAEVLLWQRLRKKLMLGFDFHRQKPVGNYIVDFFCPRLKLVIEIDGRSHDEKLAEDSERQKNLEAIGLSVLRFLDYDVKQNSEVVLSAIEEWIKDNKK